MKLVKNMQQLATIIGTCLCIGCSENTSTYVEESTDRESSKQPLNVELDPLTGLVKRKDYEEVKKALDKEEKEGGIWLKLVSKEGHKQQRMSILHPLNLPNKDASFSYENFYGMDYDYLPYLECDYSIEELHDESKEPGWFEASLKGIRDLGAKKFPPCMKWIAVIISNTIDYKGASTFEQSFKVGAIFSAADVFDSSQKLSDLIANAEMDRHPFMYDKTQPTPGKQQRWVIIERHAEK